MPPGVPLSISGKGECQWLTGIAYERAALLSVKSKFKDNTWMPLASVQDNSEVPTSYRAPVRLVRSSGVNASQFSSSLQGNGVSGSTLKSVSAQVPTPKSVSQ